MSVITDIKSQQHLFYPQTSDCSQCGIQFKNQACHLKHMRRVHGNTMTVDPLFCTKCKKTFKLTQHRDAHIRQHNDVTDLKCTSCHCKFINVQDYVQHTIKVHCKGTMCSKCCEMLPKKLDLKKHLLALQCETFRTEVSKDGKTAFELDKISKEKFQCDKCNKTFTKIGQLKAHVDFVHTGMRRAEKPDLVCELCDRRCVSKSQLANHLRTHTGSKPFQCQHCQRGFALKSNLTVHLNRWHNGQPYYKCHPRSGRKKLETSHSNFAKFQLKKPIPSSSVNSNDAVFGKFNQRDICQTSKNSLHEPLDNNTLDVLSKESQLKPLLSATNVDPYVILNLLYNNALSTDDQTQELTCNAASDIPSKSCDEKSTTLFENANTINQFVPAVDTISTSCIQMSAIAINDVEKINIAKEKTADKVASFLGGSGIEMLPSQETLASVSNNALMTDEFFPVKNDISKILQNNEADIDFKYEKTIASHDLVNQSVMENHNENTLSSTTSINTNEHASSDNEYLRRLSSDKEIDDNNLNFQIFPLDQTIGNLSTINFNELYGDLINKSCLIDTDWDTGASKPVDNALDFTPEDNIIDYTQNEAMYSEEELLSVQKRYLNNTSSVIACRNEESIQHPANQSVISKNVAHKNDVFKNDVIPNQQQVIVFNNSQSKSVEYKSNVIVKNRQRDIDLYEIPTTNECSVEANLADTWLNEFHSPSKTARSVHAQGTVLKNISDGEITDIMTSLM